MNRTTVPAIIVTLALLAVGVAVQADKSTAQTAKPTKDQVHDAKMMAQDPHNVLAMAYHESMHAFAGALHEQTVNAGPVNVDFARDAVNEMRRSFDQMRVHNEKYMATISDEVRANTTKMMQELETNRADLNVQLTALEAAVKVDIPDATKVSTLAAAVYGRLESMSKAHQSKMSMAP